MEMYFYMHTNSQSRSRIHSVHPTATLRSYLKKKAVPQHWKFAHCLYNMEDVHLLIPEDLCYYVDNTGPDLTLVLFNNLMYSGNLQNHSGYRYKNTSKSSVCLSRIIVGYACLLCIFWSQKLVTGLNAVWWLKHSRDRREFNL